MFGLSIFSTSPSAHVPDCSGELLFSNKTISVLKTSVAGYPVSFHQFTESKFLILEGKVYDRSMSSLVSKVRELSELSMTALDNFLSNVDGEFYIYLVDSTLNTLHIYGDHLNRLPLYFGQRGAQWIVSRDIYYLRSFLSSHIAPLNLAEYLVLNYNLDDRTLFSNVYSLQIGKYLCVNLFSGDLNALDRQTRNTFSSEPPILSATPDLIDRMADSFMLSCKNRSGNKNVLSLSGGMDSRSVAAGLKKAGVAFSAVTFEDEDGTATNDVLIAEEITNQLKIDWVKLRLENSSFPSDVSCAIRSKLGIQPSRFYFLYQYCRKVRDTYGENIIFFTGDGGDKVFPDLTSGLSFNSDRELFKHIIKEHCEFSIHEAALLSGVSEKELESQLLETICKLPGHNSEDKYEQFILRERMKRYIFEGEDRNRSFYWSVTPFLAQPFFGLMMSIDRTLKTDETLYRAFIARLDSAVSQIRSEKYSRGGVTVGRGMYSALKSASNILLSRKYKEYAKSLFKQSKSPLATAKRYMVEIERSNSVEQFIDMSIVSRHKRDYSVGQLSLIVTCIYLERLIGEQPVYFGRR